MQFEMGPGSALLKAIASSRDPSTISRRGGGAIRNVPKIGGHFEGIM